MLVGGGLSSVPRIARDLGVFVPKEEAVDVLAAITGVWSDDLRYRVSRVKARLKFMVDDLGPEALLELVEERLGRSLERLVLPPVDPSPVESPRRPVRRNSPGCRRWACPFTSASPPAISCSRWPRSPSGSAPTCA